jgi:hypothetical protein
MALKIGSVIKTKRGDGVITEIGKLHRSQSTGISWAMLTLDIDGVIAHAPAREDELREAPVPIAISA